MVCYWYKNLIKKRKYFSVFIYFIFSVYLTFNKHFVRGKKYFKIYFKNPKNTKKKWDFNSYNFYFVKNIRLIFSSFFIRILWESKYFTGQFQGWKYMFTKKIT